MIYDIAIIGAGVVGLNIARELSKYELNIVLLEKEKDVSLGSSKANSGIVHGGYAAKHNTLKGKLCIKGNSMYKDLNNELNFGYTRAGGMVIGFDEKDELEIKKLYDNGIKNGCTDLKIIYKEEIKKLEPNINEEVKVALYCESIGVTSPYEFAIALAENAIANGLNLKLNHKVLAVKKKDDSFSINTTKGEFAAKLIINAAGLYSDVISEMVGDSSFKIMPRKGQYVLLSKEEKKKVNTVVFQVPTHKGKGILVSPTHHSNVILGPNAEDGSTREDVSTNTLALKTIVDAARKSIPNIDLKKAITSFSGIRAISDRGDFIIEESRIRNFINVAGIESPGLTASPAIALEVIDILRKGGLELKLKVTFNAYRKSIIIKKEADFDGKIDHSEDDKNIICRCEKVTKAEILDALSRGIDIATVDSIKRRTRAGMGPCQGGFCGQRVKKIISEYKGIEIDEVAIRSEDDKDSFSRIDISEIRGLK